MVVGAAVVLLLLKVSVPLPVLMRLLGPWASEIAPEKVELLLLLMVRLEA